MSRVPITRVRFCNWCRLVMPSTTSICIYIADKMTLNSLLPINILDQVPELRGAQILWQLLLKAGYAWGVGRQSLPQQPPTPDEWLPWPRNSVLHLEWRAASVVHPHAIIDKASFWCDSCGLYQLSRPEARAQETRGSTYKSFKMRNE